MLKKKKNKIFLIENFAKNFKNTLSKKTIKDLRKIFTHLFCYKIFIKILKIFFIENIPYVENFQKYFLMQYSSIFIYKIFTKFFITKNSNYSKN